MRHATMVLLLGLVLAASATARTLRQAEPALNIRWPGGGLTGGDNGEPLRIKWRGGSTVIGEPGEPLKVNWRKGSTVLSTTDDGCGNKLGLSVVNRGKTLVDTPPCNPATAPARINAIANAGGIRPAAAVAPQAEGPIGVAGPIKPVSEAIEPMSMPVVEP